MLQAGFTVMIICGNVFIFILTPILANVIERHYTFGGKELSCLCKMLGFQVRRAAIPTTTAATTASTSPPSLPSGVQCFNTVVASTVYYFFADTFEPMRHSWYALRAMGSRPQPPHPKHVSHDPLLSRSTGTPSVPG